MAGMELVGAAAFMDGLGDMVDTFTPETDGYRLGNPVEYTAHQELGTVHQPGTPHFRPGMDATQAKMGQLWQQSEDVDEFLRLTALQWERETKSRAPVDSGTLRAGWETEPL